jgi:hypothetical protein
MCRHGFCMQSNVRSRSSQKVPATKSPAAAPKAPRGSERDDAIHHHPAIRSTAPLTIATRHPTGSRRGLLENVRLPQKPLAEASGMTLSIAMRPCAQPRRSRSPRVTPPAPAGGFGNVPAAPKAPRGSERDDAIHRHPAVCPTAPRVIATRHPTGSRRGLGVEWNASPHRLPPGAFGLGATRFPRSAGMP